MMNMKKIDNSSGEIAYGMHFYPGIAEYKEENSSHRIYLNEDTLRKMDASFAGKPIFVEHVDEVNPNLDELKGEADGWVVESFYNSADGKHWTKFILVSERAKRAVKNGYKLSNAYKPKMNGRRGIWNGVDYDNEVVDGEYEHLAIVKNPRYAESIIMTPEEFKTYNENLKTQLERISNSTSQHKEKKMLNPFQLFTRKPIENEIDYDKTYVSLPTSRKEMSILQIVNAMDEIEEKRKLNNASLDMKVTLHNGTVCNVGELVEKYKESEEKMKNTKKKNEEMDTTEGLEMGPEGLDIENEDEDDDEDDEKEKKKKEMMKKEEGEVKNKKMKNSLKNNQNFETLKNAHLKHVENENDFDPVLDKIERGRALFGSDY